MSFLDCPIVAKVSWICPGDFAQREVRYCFKLESRGEVTQAEEILLGKLLHVLGLAMQMDISKETVFTLGVSDTTKIDQRALVHQADHHSLSGTSVSSDGTVVAVYGGTSKVLADEIGKVISCPVFLDNHHWFSDSEKYSLTLGNASLHDL